MKSGKYSRGLLFGSSAATAAALAMLAAGCGTSLHSPIAAPSGGGTQAEAQPATGPKLGYVWDAGSQSLRPLQGVPGASVIGAAAVTAPAQASAYLATAVSTASGGALFLDAEGGVYQSSLAGGAFTKIASLPGASSLALSHSGGYAVVTGKSASGTAFAATISGLPGAPSVRNLNVAAPGMIVGAAASDTGTVALAFHAGTGNVSLAAFPVQGTATQAGTLQSFGGMQFAPGGDVLVAGDGATGALTAISHVSTAPASTILSPGGGISAPVALDVTSNARWVVAANAKGDILRIDLTGGTAAMKGHCSCAPNQVEALSGATVRLGTTAPGPLWIVDAGGAAPRVLFVPSPTMPTPSTAKAGTKAAL